MGRILLPMGGEQQLQEVSAAPHKAREHSRTEEEREQ